jgi:hypothetical protein
MFINYSPLSGVTVNTYRNSSAIVGDVYDVIYSIIANNYESVCCDASGVEELLEDSNSLSYLGIDPKDVKSAVKKIKNALINA